MADGRRRSAAKQARRDARRRKARQRPTAEQEALDDTPLVDEVREALDGGQPMDLLGLVSMLILVTSQPPAPSGEPEEEEFHTLEELVTAFIDTPVPETTALLAILGELIQDDEALRDRCRREVSARGDSLPPWLAALSDTRVDRAVRMTHVLGDAEEILLGVRLADEQHLTCAVYVDHLVMSAVADAFFVPSTIDAVVDVARTSNADPDTTFVDLDLSDARQRVQNALDVHLTMFRSDESDTWPGCRPLLQWLTRLMPEGVFEQALSHRDSSEDVRHRFFASLVGMPFDDVEHHELLDLCIEEGTGDPLRWSAPRLRQLLDAALVYDDVISVQAQQDVPEMLRAYVPFAHAESGIRPELTAGALTAIDDAADDYRTMVRDEGEPHP